MKYMISLASLLALAPFAAAGCYKGGAPFPQDHAGVISAITKASSHYNQMGAVGFGEKVWQKSVGDKCLKFILENIGNEEGRTISYYEAVDGFTKEYTGCHNGGDTSYTNWRYV